MQRWPLRNRNIELKKALQKSTTALSSLQIAHDNLKNKEIQQRGKIMELTVKRRDLISRHAVEKKQLFIKAEELAAEAERKVRDQHRNKTKEWERQSRAWSAERTRLKQEIDQCATALARVTTEKSNAIRRREC